MSKRSMLCDRQEATKGSQVQAGDSRRWAEFERRYRAALDREQAARRRLLLDRILRVSPVVLIYSAGDREHDAAVVLCNVLAERKFVSELPRGA